MDRTTEFIAPIGSELKDDDIPQDAVERAKRRAMLQFALGAVRRMENSITPPEALSGSGQPTVVDEDEKDR